MTRLLLMVGSALLLSVVTTGAAETWSNVPLIDTRCATKAKDSPDDHTKACALQCSKNGFGILAADGTFLKLDDAGNTKVVEALKASSNTDHLRVTVAGEREGETIKVNSVRLH
jgi:hypothetical protein